MVSVFVRISVKDYAAWRTAFDGLYELQRKSGMTAQTVYQEIGDPNEVTVIAEFESYEQAKIFGEHPRLRQAMMSAGVLEPPEVWYSQTV